MTDISKSPHKIAGMFDAIAARYDFLNHVLSAGIDRRWRARAIRALRFTGRERLLDLCTGTGDIAIAAMSARPGAARAVGVDFAGAMLRVGREKLRRARLDGRVALVRGDAMHVPVADRSVDAVTVAFGIRNVADVPAAAREMHRVLAPAGRLAILEFAMPTARGLAGFYRWYVSNVLPQIGRALSRHATAYEYLPASIDAFATPAEMMTILRQAGFSDVRADPMMLGAVILYTGTRGQ